MGPAEPESKRARVSEFMPLAFKPKGRILSGYRFNNSVRVVMTPKPVVTEVVAVDESGSMSAAGLLLLPGDSVVVFRQSSRPKKNCPSKLVSPLRALILQSLMAVQLFSIWLIV